MKRIAPVILFALVCHYVFVAALSSHVAGWRAAALIAGVLGGALFVVVMFLDMEDKP
jgi:branched-subunit amino acid transport protein